MSKGFFPSNSLAPSNTITPQSSGIIMDIRGDGEVISIGKQVLQDTSSRSYCGLEIEENRDIYIDLDSSSSSSDYELYYLINELDSTLIETSISTKANAAIDCDANGNLVCFGRKLTNSNNSQEGLYIAQEEKCDADIWFELDNNFDNNLLSLWNKLNTKGE